MSVWETAENQLQVEYLWQKFTPAKDGSRVKGTG